MHIFIYITSYLYIFHFPIKKIAIRLRVSSSALPRKSSRLQVSLSQTWNSRLCFVDASTPAVIVYLTMASTWITVVEGPGRRFEGPRHVPHGAQRVLHRGRPEGRSGRVTQAQDAASSPTETPLLSIWKPSKWLKPPMFT